MTISFLYPIRFFNAFIFFSSAKSKLVWYIVPLYPVALLIVGKLVHDVIMFVITKILRTDKLVYVFLAVYSFGVLGLGYLYLNRELVYHTDLTGAQALLLQKKDEIFGVEEKVYADRIDLPLVLFYSDGPYEVVDFGPLRDKLAFVVYNQHIIFITKESRFRKYSETHPELSLEDSIEEWVLGYLPSKHEKDLEKLDEYKGAIKKIEDGISAKRDEGAQVPPSWFGDLVELNNRKSALEEVIENKLSSI